MKAVITNAKPETIQQDGSKFLDVEFNILDGEEIIDTKRLGFDLDASPDTIRDEVSRYVANYEAEKIAREANAEEDAEEAQVDATIAEIVGEEIVPSV